jgi:reverse gyrase
MKIINQNDFFKVLLKTDYCTKCFIKLNNSIKFCPHCIVYFNSTEDNFCSLCKKRKLMIKNNFIVNAYDLSDTCFVGINSLNGKRISFDIDNVVYFDNQEEEYFIVNI